MINRHKSRLIADSSSHISLISRLSVWTYRRLIACSLSM